MAKHAAAFRNDAFEQQYQGKRNEADRAQQLEVVQIGQQIGLLKKLLMNLTQCAEVGVGGSDVSDQDGLTGLDRILKRQVVRSDVRHQSGLMSLRTA